MQSGFGGRMNCAIKWMDEYLEEALLAALLVAITGVSFLQVVMRKIPWVDSLTWAEEFCRFAWVWSVFLSLPYTIKRGSMLRVSALLDAVPYRLRGVLGTLAGAINLAAMALLFCCSIPLIADRFASGETSPAMQWPVWTVYASVVLGFGLAVFRGVQAMLRGRASAGGQDESSGAAEHSVEGSVE